MLPKSEYTTEWYKKYTCIKKSPTVWPTSHFNSAEEVTNIYFSIKQNTYQKFYNYLKFEEISES